MSFPFIFYKLDIKKKNSSNNHSEASAGSVPRFPARPACGSTERTVTERTELPGLVSPVAPIRSLQHCRRLQRIIIGPSGWETSARAAGFWFFSQVMKFQCVGVGSHVSLRCGQGETPPPPPSPSPPHPSVPPSLPGRCRTPESVTDTIGSGGSSFLPRAAPAGAAPPPHPSTQRLHHPPPNRPASRGSGREARL